MFHDSLKIIPLFFAALLGAYLCAVVVALLDRRRKNKAGSRMGVQSRLFKGAFTMWIPICFCVGPGLYSSAVIGSLCGALICSAYLTLKYGFAFGKSTEPN